MPTGMRWGTPAPRKKKESHIVSLLTSQRELESELASSLVVMVTLTDLSGGQGGHVGGGGQGMRAAKQKRSTRLMRGVLCLLLQKTNPLAKVHPSPGHGEIPVFIIRFLWG